MARPRNRPTDVWRYVQRGSPDECWPWTGAQRRRGYGVFSIATREYVAHRLVFQVTTGIDPGDQLVCHRCDNPPCCNPAHLFLGTHTDNVRDMLAKGRARPPRGAEHHAAKLTEDMVREIRRLASAGHKQVGLARRFGISSSHVNGIVQRRFWRHV